MASADHGRSRRDEDRYRDSRRRDDKFSDRRHDDRRDRDRERDRERDRDRDRNRRRSRSPDFRRDRRERSRDRDRYRNDRGPRRDYDGRDNRRDGRDARDSRGDSRDNRGGDRAYDRHRGSKSATPARALESRSDDRLSRDEKPKDKSMQEKLARLAEWKKKQAEKKAQQVAETDGTAQSPTTTAPTTTAPTTTAPTTTASVTPTVTSEPAKAQPQVNGNAEVAKQKNTVKLDETAKVKPLQSKPVGVTVPAVRQQAKAPSLSTNDAIALKFKPKATQELQEEKSALLDDEGETSKKRKLQALPASVPEYTPLDDVEEDAAMSDIASDEEQKQLEKRRADIAIEDTHMEDAPTAPEDKMEVEDEDVDPLDAFMADLTEKPARGAPQGQAMFGEDLEPDMNAIKDDDLFALAAARKKKKEVPIIDHSKVAYEPFRKHFYTAPQEISDMTDEEVADLRLQLDGIKVKPATVPRPVLNFAQMGLMTATLDVLRGVGYETPTPIQSQAVSIILSGIDVLAVARTGSGKTLAFILPTIRHILDQPPLKPTDGPICLVVAPTRELALQIVNEAKPFLKASNLKIACAYGGPPISEHIALMKRGGIHILVATPGRLIDLIQANSGRAISLKRITYLVLDEADRMLDMGFEPQVMKILANIRPDRQAMLFSATFPKSMAALARKLLSKPAEIIIGGRSVVAPQITQIVKVVPAVAAKKMDEVLLYLGQLFQEENDYRALIFVERQETAEDLLSKLLKRSYPCNTLHGAKDQTDRTDAINDFRNGVCPVLIATSVAARGLDVEQLKLVINYDAPSHLEDYVHRCGRTGRAGNTGTAVTLLTEDQDRFAVHIEKALLQSGQEIPEDVKKLAETFKAKVTAGTEKWYDPGFGGKGLDKLDAARAQEKRREKRAHKGDFGDDESDSEAEALPTVVKNNAGGAAADTSAAAAESDEPAYMKLLRGKIIVNKTERPAPESSKPKSALSAYEKAKAAAAGVDGRLGKKGAIHHGQPIDNKGPDAGLFHSTIEINDFPQKARWAVTNRTNVAKILEATGTSITTKGTHYAAGKQPGPEDLPPLYILVEGDTENSVTSAMMELTRLLRDGTLAAEEAGPRGATGRYSVV